MPVLILLPSISPMVASRANLMKLAVKAHSVLNRTKNSKSLSDTKKGTKMATKASVKIQSDLFINNLSL
jgi:hypothetical protein